MLESVIKNLDKVYTNNNCLFKIELPFADKTRQWHKPEIGCCIGRSIDEVLEQYSRFQIKGYPYDIYHCGNYISVEIYNTSIIGIPYSGKELKDVDIFTLKELIERNSEKREIFLSPDMSEVYYERYYMNFSNSGSYGKNYLIDYGLLYDNDRYSNIQVGDRFNTEFVHCIIVDVYGTLLTKNSIFEVMELPKSKFYSHYDVFYGISSESDELIDYSDTCLIPVSTMKFID